MLPPTRSSNGFPPPQHRPVERPRISNCSTWPGVTWPSVIRPSVIRPSVIWPSVIWPSVIRPSVIRFCLILISIIPFRPSIAQEAAATQEDIVKTDPSQAEGFELRLLSERKQLTFEGKRGGEGYFSRDGKQMVFQSERDPDNPFFQIYLLDLETGDQRRISNGTGKTTCAWIHPDGKRVLFASTHDDPQAKTKQRERIDQIASGNAPRYAWDYDPTYELYEAQIDTGALTQLTHATGYDAEGSYSNDGRWLAFASNRGAYEKTLGPSDQKRLEVDSAYFCDIYLMDMQTGDVKQMTETVGYDGGPFFSSDSKKICWRRFDVDGVIAEIHTMNVDGTDARQITSLNAMSWAPYFHPSGDYLVFATNRHGFDNFELYLVRADGNGSPQRVTFTAGFDGLPSFSPDGKQLSWTSNRAVSKKSQIFLADWDDAAARELLDLPPAAARGMPDTQEAIAATSPEFRPEDIGRHIEYLCNPALEGRMTGSPGEQMATEYAALYLEALGFEPAAPDGSFYQSFEFPAGASLGPNNALKTIDQSRTVDQAWRPLAFSGTGPFADAPVVFAGYGLVAPGADGIDEYDSYVHLDVDKKWVVVFRDLPQEIPTERRQHWARYSSPRRKAMEARDRGARGIIFVAGPTSRVKQELIGFGDDASQSGTSIAVLSIDDALASEWFRKAGKDLAAVQKQLDSGDPAMGYELTGVTMNADVDIVRKTGTGRNVIARLKAGDQVSGEALIVGAHIDHLGRGRVSGSSLAKEDEIAEIHFGADDNASGVAGALEIAQYLAAEKKSNRLKMKRDLMVALWSGEELGLFGSEAYCRALGEAMSANVPKDDVHAQMFAADAPLYPFVAAYLNLDMIGRLREKLSVQGVGSSSQWANDVPQRNVPVGVPLQIDTTSSNLPTDAATFFKRGVPILSAFTGSHDEYHTPRDRPELINFDGAAKTARLFGLIARGVLQSDKPPPSDPSEATKQESVPRARLTAFLGTVPDYVAGDIKGVKLSGVKPRGPAENAGLRGGDVIIELAGRKIENIYDYTFAIEGLKVGEPVDIVVLRGEEKVTLPVTPESRE
jgi:Tol biopolymer transport system component